jgi:photosystem II stability/assembly factor-like uncharacterized protein/peptide methionine sulfoxide reductase MsrB
MRDPDDRPRGRHYPPLEGGKARERLTMFYQARGITEQTSEQTIERYAEDYSAAVVQAIAAAAAAGPGRANQPQWRFLGPDLMTNGQAGTATVPSRVTVSGRLSAIAVDPGNANHLLCASAMGGIWESFTRGADWAPRTDFMATLTTGAIAFDPVNPSVVYAGTGEGNSNWYFGQGMLRSADGGTTWALLTDKPFIGQGFFAIIVDPANTQHLLAATQGRAAAAAPATGGVYQSADGGRNWKQVYAAKACWDLSMQPGGGTAAEVLAATTDGLLRSADGGTIWASQPLDATAPASWTRLAVSISPKDPTVAFAFGASAGQRTPYIGRRSGGTWSAIPTPKAPDGTAELIDTGQAAYDWYAAASPDNAGQVYLGAKDVFRGDLSADGTAWAWTNLSTKNPGDSIHPDQHAIAFDPASPATIYCGGDGGLFRSPDRGTTWVSLNPGLGIAEIVYMVDDNINSRWLLAGTQDNGSIRYLGTSAFEHVADGDGGDCGIDQTRIDPAAAATCYHTFTRIDLARSTAGGGWKTWTDITPPVPNPMPADYCLFYPPVGVSGSTVAIAGKSVLVSRDTGTTWKEVPLPGITTAQYVTAVYAATSDLIYVATQYGRVFTIAYANGTWTPTQLTRPRTAYVSAIRVDPSSRVWVTMTETGDGTPGNGQVWRSDDGGKTWNDKTAGLPNLPLTSVEFDTATPGRVWVSADVGVYQSLDGGGTWAPFFQNLPYAIVEDLEFHPTARVLRAGTRSRGIWEAAVDQPGSSAPPQAVQACSVLQNADGSLTALGVGTDRTVGYTGRVAGAYSNSGWSGWASVWGVITSALATAANDDGSVEVFARWTDGTLVNTRLAAPGSPLTVPTGWRPLGGFLTGNPAVARNYTMQGSGRPGRLEVFARGHDGTLWHIYQTVAGTGWSAWESLSGVITSKPAAILNVTNLEVFARQADGTLGHITSGSPSWSPWESLGGVITGNPAVALNADGRLEVFARRADGTLGHMYRTASGSGWSGWESLGGALAGDPAVTRNQDGRLEVFARRADGTLGHTYQTLPRTGSSWSAWESLGGALTSDPAVICNQDGRLEAFARGTGNALYHTYQTAPGSGWSAWESLGGMLLGIP